MSYADIKAKKKTASALISDGMRQLHTSDVENRILTVTDVDAIMARNGRCGAGETLRAVNHINQRRMRENISDLQSSNLSLASDVMLGTTEDRTAYNHHKDGKEWSEHSFRHRRDTDNHA